MGRRLFDIIDAPTGWRDEMGYGARHAATPAFFVVTHAPPEAVRLELDFTFVTVTLRQIAQPSRLIEHVPHTPVSMLQTALEMNWP
jgi:hypothetical protein